MLLGFLTSILIALWIMFFRKFKLERLLLIYGVIGILSVYFYEISYFQGILAGFIVGMLLIVIKEI